jgi:uncharacterized protein GlcG (DUF336 family)
MHLRSLLIASASILFSGSAIAQVSPLPEGVPAEMPFSTPYGDAISMDQAKLAVEAAIADAAARNWKIAVAVVSPAGELIYFAKMDDTQSAGWDIAIRKARTSALFRRETAVFVNAVATNPAIGTLHPDIVVSPGGLPIVINGEIVGGIGCSGAAGPQDAVSCSAGLAALTE